MPYSEWKSMHQTEATKEQLDAFKSKDGHAY